MRFANLAAFHWLWVLMIILTISVLYRRFFQPKIEKVFGQRLLPFLQKSVSQTLRNWKLILQSFAILLMIVALARPQMGAKTEQVKSEGIEIIFAIDVSESMMAEDVKPNRLEQVKAELNKLIDLMPGNKIGIIAFAGTANLQTPITNDPSALKMYLEALSPNSVSSQGTNFEEALRTAKEAFDRGGASTDETHRVTRMILIASDGEDHEAGALKYADEMTKQGIVLFSLAYGTEKGGTIPVRDGMGFLKGYKKDRQGQVILTTVKGDALKELARMGKGSFYFASFGGNHLRQIADDVNRLEKTQFDSTVATQYEEKFQLFLIIALILMLIEVSLGERRKAFRFWKGRYEVPPA